jgi:hypothetical protein
MFLGEMLCTSLPSSLACLLPRAPPISRCDAPSLTSLSLSLPCKPGLIAFRFLNSRLNPWSPKSHARRHASSSARAAALASQSARLHTAPLSRPDESAIFFNESAISLHEDETRESAKVVVEPEERVLDWRKAALFWAPAACDICGTTASAFLSPFFNPSNPLTLPLKTRRNLQSERRSPLRPRLHLPNAPRRPRPLGRRL